MKAGTRGNTIYFAEEFVKGSIEKAHGGVRLDFDASEANRNLWPDGKLSPEMVLCVCESDPTHYKIFTYANDVTGTGFRSTGKDYGGVYKTFPPFPRGLDRKADPK